MTIPGKSSSVGRLQLVERAAVIDAADVGDAGLELRIDALDRDEARRRAR